MIRIPLDMDSENKHIDPVGMLPKFLLGDTTPEENRVVNEWLSASPDNQSAYEAFIRIWEMTSTVTGTDDINLDSEWQKLESAITPVRTIPLAWKRIIQVAASILLIVAMGIVGFKMTGSRSEKAPMHKLSAMSLPDGTYLSLNAGSRIIFKKGFGVTHRNLSLKGEAYFEVKAGSIPFIINAGEASVRVTGTKFNVKAYADKPEVKVTVTEGTVKLYETDQPLHEASLSAGATGTYNRSAKVIEKQLSVNMNDLSWKTGIIDFQNTRLSEVAEVLMNTYHIQLEIDPAVQNCLLTVRFENQELDSVISVLKSTLDLSVIRRKRNISISGKGC